MQIFRSALFSLLVLSSGCATADQWKGPTQLGLEADLTRSNKQPPLCSKAVVSNPQREQIARLLATVNRPGLKDILDESPTYYAVLIDSPPELKRLLALGYDTSTRDGSLLHAAAYWNSVASAGYLLDHGTNINVADRGGGTPLMTAVGQGGPDVARLLLARGARVDTKTLDYALICKDQVIVDLLVRSGVLIDQKARQIARKTHMQLPKSGR